MVHAIHRLDNKQGQSLTIHFWCHDSDSLGKAGGRRPAGERSPSYRLYNIQYFLTNVDEGHHHQGKKGRPNHSREKNMATSTADDKEDR